MTSSPRISIVTPTYNRSDALLRAIRSVQRQSLEDYEHIIVDDGSFDQTDEMILGIDDPRIRYFQLSCNRGANMARNFGIREARGEWITFLDSDDEYLPHRLQTTLQDISRNPATNLRISSHQFHKQGRVIQCQNRQVFLNGKEFEKALMFYALKVAGSSITVRRDLLEHRGGFAPELKRLQDRQLLLALSQFSGAAISSEIDWVKHYSHDSISEKCTGYVNAIDRLLDLHPDLIVRYRKIIAYDNARTIVNRVLRSQFLTAFSEWQANLQGEHLHFGFLELFRDYVEGRSVRKEVLLKINGKA